MKRLLLILIAVLLLVQPALAQGPGYQIYLPYVAGGNMGSFAVLQITDGVTSIDLLHGPIYLTDWTPSVPQSKGGGVWQDSPLATGRRLVDRRFGNVTDSLTLDVSTPNQDDTIRTASDLFRLLEKSRDFSASGWQSDPVWIKRQASCETSPTYALIFDYRITDMAGNPYSAPFFGERSTLSAFALIMEHSIWLGYRPGTGGCVQASSVQEWDNTTWELATALPNDVTYSFIQSTTGRIFAGELGNIFYSDDDGVNWALSTALPVSFVRSMLQTTTGRILAGENGEIWYTDDDGANWFSATALPVDIVASLLQTTSGRILAGELGQIWYSDDNGASWAVLTTIPVGYVDALIQTVSGRILAGENGQIWYSDDDGDTWALSTTKPVTYVLNFLQTPTGRIMAGETDKVWLSDDDGAHWSGIAVLSGGGLVFCSVQAADGTIYIGHSLANTVLSSIDDGLTWTPITTLANGVYSFLISTTGRLFVGQDGQITRYGPIASIDLGATATCDDEVFIANKQNIANLTHIFVYDAVPAGWSANLFPITSLTTLLPAAPAINDIIYFGIDMTATNAGPFESLVFDLSSVIQYTNSYTITWEYVSAVGPGPGFALTWSTLTVQDGTNPGTGTFRTPGVSSVNWEPPAGWVDTGGGSVNGVTGWWVRAKVTALVGTLTPPVQAATNIYTVVLPYAEVAAAQVSGDIPALAEFKLHNRGDKDGLSNPPYLHDNRILAGLRSYDRGPTFSAYLNASDVQNPVGVTVTDGANTDITVPNVETVTGHTAVYTGDGLGTWSDEITFTLGSTIARDYYGAYHAFVRGQADGGAVLGDIHARLQVRTGSGGVLLTTADDYFKTSEVFEVLDLGRITIPASGVLDFADLGDSTQLVIQLRDDGAGALDHLIHDLVLIPVDEWQLDAVDYSNTATSIIGRQGGIPHLLDADSLITQKADIRTLVRTADGNGFVSAIYVPTSPGPAILQSNARQRLWVLAMQTVAIPATDDYTWLASAWIAHSIQILANPRYLGYRGNR